LSATTSYQDCKILSYDQVKPGYYKANGFP